MSRLVSTINAPPGFFDPEPPEECDICHEHEETILCQHDGCLREVCEHCGFLCTDCLGVFCQYHRDSCGCIEDRIAQEADAEESA